MRIFFNILLVVSALFFPWWATGVFMIAACSFVPRFYEVVIYGIAIDALYSSSYGFHGFSWVWSAYASAVLLAAHFLRSRLSW